MSELSILLMLILLSYCLVVNAGTLTYEEFLGKIGAGERQIDYSQGLINHRKLHQLITQRKKSSNLSMQKKDAMRMDTVIPPGTRVSGEDENASTEKISKTSNDPTLFVNQPVTEPDSSHLSIDSNIDVENVKPDGKLQAHSNSDKNKKIKKSKKTLETVVQYVYVSPSLRNVLGDGNVSIRVGRESNINNILSLPTRIDTLQATMCNEIQMMSPNRSVTFGITIGTAIPVKLSTGASNVQPGYVQLIVQSDVIGDKKTLVKGSTIFCRANAVLGSPRLYTSSIRGITEDTHIEFTIKGNVFADDGKAGFLAEVISDGRGLARAKDAGISALGTGIMSMMPNVNLATGASKAAAAVVLDENNEDNRVKNWQLNYVLEAAPQLAKLQIEETF